MANNHTVRSLLGLIGKGALSPRDKETVARCMLRAQVNRGSDELDFTRLSRDEFQELERHLACRTQLTEPVEKEIL